MPEQFVLTIIGLFAATVGWIINQVLMKRWEAFRSDNKNIALERLERAYQPLYVITGDLVLKWKNGEDESDLKRRLGNILENHGHLLSPDAQNFAIACRYMRTPDLNSVRDERAKLATEIEKLKNLVYPSYKVFEQYYTSGIFGKLKIFWLQMQYRIFSLIVTLGVVLSFGYLIAQNPSVILWLVVVYLVVGSVFYLVYDHRRAKTLQGKAPGGVKQTRPVHPLSPKHTNQDPNGAAKPSAEVSEYSGELLDIQYPYNFQYTLPAKKGETIFALQIKGLREDSDIIIDILPAKKLTVEKVFEQNKGKFKPKTTGEATIDGNPAKYLTTSPTPNIERRVYFTVKNDKMYRVILTWNKPMTGDFQPAFEKALASLKIK